MEIEIKGKKYLVKEMPYIEAVCLDPKDRKQMASVLFKQCLGMTDEEVSTLNIADGRRAEQAIAEVNGFKSEDFQNPAKINELKTS